MHLLLSDNFRANHRRLLRPGCLTAPVGVPLVLLPSGPDTVREPTLRKTRSSTPLTMTRPHKSYPRVGIQPSYSGLLVQGTATSPSSTVIDLQFLMAERAGFEPANELPHYMISSHAPSTKLGHLSIVLIQLLLATTY